MAGYFTSESNVFSACSCRSGGAPYSVFAIFPDRSKRNMVGTEVMSPNACAVAGSVIAQCRSELREPAVERISASGDSTARATIARVSPYFCLRSPSHVKVERQGGHQVAQ